WRAGNKVEIVEDIRLSFWLCHDRNLSNPARTRRFTHKTDEIRRTVGHAAWKDSDQQLQALKQRLGITRSSNIIDVASKPTAVVAVQSVSTAKPDREKNEPGARSKVM